MKRLALVSSDGWKSRHERCVVLKARRRSPNKRLRSKSIALVQIYIFRVNFHVNDSEAWMIRVVFMFDRVFRGIFVYFKFFIFVFTKTRQDVFY